MQPNNVSEHVQSINVDNIGVVISGLLLIVTVVSAIYAIRAYQHQKQRAKKEAGCKLARIYADVVLSKYKLVNEVMEKTKLLDFIRDLFPMNAISLFSYSEMSGFVEKADCSIDDVKTKMRTFDPLIILDAKLVQTKVPDEVRSLQETFSEYDPATHQRIPKHEEILLSQFSAAMADLMNTLEWFAMYCRYGLADEEIIYQSLHQTYLSMVWLLYFYISSNNTSNENKYFTNVIWLFERWRDRLNEQTDLTKQDQQKADAQIREAQELRDNAGREFAGQVLR